MRVEASREFRFHPGSHSGLAFDGTMQEMGDTGERRITFLVGQAFPAFAQLSPRSLTFIVPRHRGSHSVGRDGVPTRLEQIFGCLDDHGLIDRFLRLTGVRTGRLEYDLGEIRAADAPDESGPAGFRRIYAHVTDFRQTQKAKNFISRSLASSAASVPNRSVILSG